MPYGPCNICGATNCPSSCGGPYICPSWNCNNFNIEEDIEMSIIPSGHHIRYGPPKCERCGIYEYNHECCFDPVVIERNKIFYEAIAMYYFNHIYPHRLIQYDDVWSTIEEGECDA
jgi:hypothetical protein